MKSTFKNTTTLKTVQEALELANNTNTLLYDCEKLVHSRALIFISKKEDKVIKIYSANYSNTEFVMRDLRTFNSRFHKLQVIRENEEIKYISVNGIQYPIEKLGNQEVVIESNDNVDFDELDVELLKLENDLDRLNELDVKLLKSKNDLPESKSDELIYIPVSRYFPLIKERINNRNEFLDYLSSLGHGNILYINPYKNKLEIFLIDSVLLLSFHYKDNILYFDHARPAKLPPNVEDPDFKVVEDDFNCLSTIFGQADVISKYEDLEKISDYANIFLYKDKILPIYKLIEVVDGTGKKYYTPSSILVQKDENKYTKKCTYNLDLDFKPEVLDYMEPELFYKGKEVKGLFKINMKLK